MEDDVELDEFRVVNVTGKAYKDTPRSREKKSRWNPSVREKTIIIFACIGAVFVIGAIVLITTMKNSLNSLDKDSLRKSIDRFVMLFIDDIERLQPYNKHAAWQRVTAEAAMEAKMFSKNNKNPVAFPNGPAITKFVQRYLNTSVAYHDDGTVERVYRCGSMVNVWMIIDAEDNCTPLWYVFHNATEDEYCTLAPINGPRQVGPPLQKMFPEEFLKNMIGSMSDPEEGVMSVFRVIIVEEAMTISIQPIMIPDDDGIVRDKKIYGYLLAAKMIKYHMQSFADNLPGCITVNTSLQDEADFDDEELKNWESSVAGALNHEKIFNGVPVFATRNATKLARSKSRYCPDIPLFNDTDEMMVGYFKLCGQNPNVTTRTTCLSYRMDRPMSRVEEGTNPVILLSVLVVILMIILFVLFIFFLDFAVLRRVVKLSQAIRKQTSHHRKEVDLKEDVDDEPGVTDGDAKKGRKGKSSDRASKSSSEDSGNAHRSGDEIRNLQLAVEQNTNRLRKRIQAIDDVAKLERQKILHHKNAMQLLSLWCDRKDFFPGLRPDAAMLRYEPTRNLDDLLSNPIAVEYLKSHCDSDCTLENLFFYLDVSWLYEIEYAEDKEEDAAKRALIHDVASGTAAAIIERYIAEDAPQQINISAATFKVLRSRGTSYKRGMFNDAVGEVKLMLDTDILPRFQSSTAYNAMSENIYVDGLAEEDSDWSSESVSTAGSVLSDEPNNGAPNVVAFNFRNLYATFDGDSDLGSTYTNELSIVEDPEPVTSSMKTGSTLKPGSGKPASGSHERTISSSNKDDESSVDDVYRRGQPQNKDEGESSSSSTDSKSSDSSSTTSSSN